jgi:ATP-dependent RNA helicase SUPV3L1/SUV3
VRLYGELGGAAARERAARRLEAFLAAEAGRRLRPLRNLDAAVSEGRIKGLARGIAYRLIEAGGVLDRGQVREEAKALSQVERRALKGLGVRLGAFSLFLPALLKPQALAYARALAAPSAGGWRPPADAVSPLPQPAPPAPILAANGLRAVGGLAVPVESLERLDDLLRAAPRQGPGAVFSDQAREALGWSPEEARAILFGLGFSPTARPKAGAPAAWRRRSVAAPDSVPRKPPVDSPFAALAALRSPPPAVAAPRPRPRRRRKPATARKSAQP